MTKICVLFVGSFVTKATDGTVGGQGFACQSLLTSRLSENISWVTLDSTQKTQPPPGILIRGLNAFKRLAKLAILLSTTKIDTVLVFSAFSPVSFSEKGIMVVLASLFRKRTVLAIRSEVKTEEHYVRTSGFRRFVLERCTKIICQSDTNKQALMALNLTNPEKIQTIPNWLNTSLYRQRQPQTPLKVKFLYLGWLIDYKGVRELIASSLAMYKQGCTFELHIGGGGPLESLLKDQVAEVAFDHEITFHGWVYNDEKYSLLESCDVLVLPSYTEGMSNALLEGMASGLAVIATRVGGANSVVGTNNGLLIEPESEEDLGHAMSHMINAPECIKHMGRHNIKYIEDHHTLATVLPDMANILGVTDHEKFASNAGRK